VGQYFPQYYGAFKKPIAKRQGILEAATRNVGNQDRGVEKRLSRVNTMENSSGTPEKKQKGKNRGWDIA
jgi:hypothetical protein